MLIHCGLVKSYGDMASCLTAPMHYLSRCWLIINEFLWHLSERNLTGNAQGTYSCDEFEITNIRLQSHLPGASKWNARLQLRRHLTALGGMSQHRFTREVDLSLVNVLHFPLISHTGAQSLVNVLPFPLISQTLEVNARGCRSTPSSRWRTTF